MRFSWDNDTFNFTLLGRVHVKELIVGPVRAVLPLNGENLAACTAGTPISSATSPQLAPLTYVGVDYTDAAAADDCIVVKLMGAAVGGGVNVVNVTKGDVTSGP